MTQYALKEMTVLALLGALGLTLFPSNSLLVAWAVFIVFVILSLLSRHAFQKGIAAGLVREAKMVGQHSVRQRAFSIAPGCPRVWLVKRHIRMFY